MACEKPVPLYAQLKEHVLENIRSGAWRAGERVPSEHELVREFKVSRMTANRALRELMRSGVLDRVALSSGTSRRPRIPCRSATLLRRSVTAGIVTGRWLWFSSACRPRTACAAALQCASKHAKFSIP
jgi:DNA-binding transcriptional MocR family regulator